MVLQQQRQPQLPRRAGMNTTSANRQCSRRPHIRQRIPMYRTTRQANLRMRDPGELVLTPRATTSARDAPARFGPPYPWRWKARNLCSQCTECLQQRKIENGRSPSDTARRCRHQVRNKTCNSDGATRTCILVHRLANLPLAHVSRCRKLMLTSPRASAAVP